MILIIVLTICLAIFTLYVIVDNYTVDVKYSDVFIQDLPEEFNNYTILQMTDLHSKEFGKNLYSKVNNIQYDMIALTGDMVNNRDYNMKSFKNLLNNINDKKLIVYVDGNNGPQTFSHENNKVTKFGKTIESLGCTLLKDTYSIEKSNSRIWLSNFNLATNMFCYGKKYSHRDLYKQKFSHIGNDVSIGIGHEPVGKEVLKSISMNKIKHCKYDLIMTGHYHGGQIRVPFYGALYVPARTARESFFPEQEIISGLYTYENINQYVSTGLGSSKRIPIINFRLFNTPHIDVIRLKNK